jgi:peptidoglycan/LPS O-acetylase OafA/YrhL
LDQNGTDGRKLRQRIHEIDGLRGLASLLVVLFHFRGELHDEIVSSISPTLDTVLGLGHLGVMIFFVLSGYVIAMSIGLRKITWRFFGVFALKRSIRLDPPYWASLAFVLAFTLVKAKLFPSLATPFPTAPAILSHLVYLQNVLGFGDLLPVYWTLCYEIQFYILLVALIAFAQVALRSEDPSRFLSSPAAMIVGVGFGVTSAFLFCVRSQFHFHGLAVPYWCFFYLGALTFWSGQTRTFTWPGIFLCLCTLLVSVNFELLLPLAVAATTSALIAARSRLTWISRLLRSTPALGLGKISYSLYLIHAIFGWTTISLAKRLGILAWAPPGLQTIGLFSLGVLASIAASAVLYRVVERPAAQLSQRI